MRKRLDKRLTKAQTSDSMKAFAKLTEDVEGHLPRLAEVQGSRRQGAPLLRAPAEGLEGQLRGGPGDAARGRRVVRAHLRESYADQNERDYATLMQAVDDGRLTVQTGY